MFGRGQRLDLGAIVVTARHNVPAITAVVLRIVIAFEQVRHPCADERCEEERRPDDAGLLIAC